MKIWQVVLLVYLTTGVVGAYSGRIGSPLWVDFLMALAISLLGILLIRRIERQNPNK